MRCAACRVLSLPKGAAALQRRWGYIHGAGTVAFPPRSHSTSTKQQQPPMFLLSNYSYISIKGADAKKFLQGLCTNDINQLNSTTKNCIAAAFLTPQGRVFADAILYYRGLASSSSNSSSSGGSTITTEGDDIIIETDKKLSKKLLQYLKMYKLKSKIEISELGGGIKTLFLASTTGSSRLDNDTTENSYRVIAKSWDPRAEGLGARLLVDCSSSGSNSELSMGDAEETYSSYRMSQGIAEGIELVDRIPLECNLDLLNYISFSKGCYVGQELTARTKYKGLVRKRLVPFTVTTTIINPPPRVKETTATVSGTTPEGADNFVLLDVNFADLMNTSPYRLSGRSTDSSSLICVGDKIIGRRLPSLLGEGAAPPAPLTPDNDITDSIDCGKIIAVDSRSSVGIALVALQYVLSPNSLLAKGSLSARPAAGGESRISLRLFRPSWFPDIDKVTGKKLDDFGSL